MDDLYDLYEDDTLGDDLYYEVDDEDDAYASGGGDDIGEMYDYDEPENPSSDDEFLAEEEAEDFLYSPSDLPNLNLSPSPRTPPRTPPRELPAMASQVEDVPRRGTSPTPPSPTSPIPETKSLLDMVLDVATGNLDSLVHKKLWYSMPSSLVLKVFIKAKRKGK